MARVTELVFRGTDRGVVRSLDRIASQSDRTSRQLGHDSDKSSASFDRMGRSAHGLRNSIGGLAGVVGLGGLAFGLKDIIQKGMEWQQQQAALQGALKNTGQLGKRTLEQLSNASEGLAVHGGFSAPQNLQALTRFVTVTHDVGKAQRDLALTTNISRQSGFEFMRVQRAIMMLEAGRTTGLARLGIAIPKVTAAEDALKSTRLAAHDKVLALEAAGVKLTASQKAQLSLTNQVTPAMMAQAKAQDALASQQAAIAQLQQRFSGATDRYSRTTAGRVNDMKNAWDNFQRTLGSKLLPTFTQVLRIGTKIMDFFARHKQLTLDLVLATTILAGTFATLSIMDGLAGMARTLGVSFSGMATEEGIAAGASGLLATAMDLIPIFAIVAGIVLLITHWKQVKAVLIDVWSWIKGHWPLLAGVLLGPFGLAVGYVVTHWKDVTHALGSVIGWVKGAWAKLRDALTWPFREAWKEIKKILGFVEDALNQILHPGSHKSAVAHGPLTAAQRAQAQRQVNRIFGQYGTSAPQIQTPNAHRQILGGGQDSSGVLGGVGSGVDHAHVHTTIKLDGRTIAKSVTRAVLERAARGNTSLVGGALVTGSRATNG